MEDSVAETMDDKNLKEGGAIPDYTFNTGKQGAISIKDFMPVKANLPFIIVARINCDL